MIRLPNHIYVELYADMAEAILLDRYKGQIDLYITEPNGDQRYTDQAQDLFHEYCGLVEDVLKNVGIGSRTTQSTYPR